MGRLAGEEVHSGGGGGDGGVAGGAGRSHLDPPLLYARAQRACSICPEPCCDRAAERPRPRGDEEDERRTRV